MCYRFVIAILFSIAFIPGVARADDQRTAVVVTPDGRDYILNEYAYYAGNSAERGRGGLRLETPRPPSLLHSIPAWR